MRIAVVGDLLLDFECRGSTGPTCPENDHISLFRGSHVQVFAGGAGSVSNILTGLRATVDLYCSGPGDKREAWIADLAKKVLRVNRVVFSGQGSIPLKVRGVGHDGVVSSRIDCEEVSAYTGPFQALDMLLDECRGGRYDGVLVSDYCKGTIGKQTEQVVSEIVRSVRCSVVDSKRTSDYGLWHGATALTPNRQEAWATYGTEDPCEIQRLVGSKCVYVTRGADAVLMGCADGTTEIAVDEQIEQKYVVGAGDSFAAAVLVALCQGRSYIEAGMAGVQFAQQYVRRGRKPVLK